jgi:formylglycine-generating enzyme
MFTTQQLDRKRRELEEEISEICMAGTDLVPTDEGKVRILEIGEWIKRASHGRNEVLFDKAGRVHIMVNFFCDEKARLDYLSNNNTLFNSADSTLQDNIHPAFIIENTPIKGFRLAKYLMPRYSGKNYVASLYGMSPAWGSGGFSVSTTGSIQACYDSNSKTTNPDGIELHLETDAEYSFLQLLGARRAFECHGNTTSGKYHGDTTEIGQPATYVYSSTHKDVQSRTGTGPLTWYHDGTPWGVADLVGNMLEWVNGFRTKAGELQFLPNNDGAKKGWTPSDFASSSTKWKALKEDGTFVTIDGEEATYKYDYPSEPTGNYQALCLSTSVVYKNSYYGSVSLKGMTIKDGVTANDYVRVTGHAPLLANTPNGVQYLRTTDSVYACGRGGSWNSGSGAGLSFAGCGSGLTDAHYGYSARSASLI